MNAAEKAEALASIRQDLGGLGLGLVLGAIACHFVRPSNKATNAFEMARRWLAWGLLGSITAGVSFYVRHFETHGSLGGPIIVIVYGGIAWGLGYLWGLVRFGRPRRSEPSSTGTATIVTSQQRLDGTTRPHVGVVLIGVAGIGILGLVMMSAIKSGLEGLKTRVAAGAIGAQETPEEAKSDQWVSYTQADLDKIQDVRRAMLEKRVTTQMVQELLPMGFEGLKEAQSVLAECYEKGLGVAEDQKTALDWYLKAANSGDERAQIKLADYYLDRAKVQTTLTTRKSEFGLDDQTTDERKGAEWLLKAAKQGNKRAQRAMSELYDEGRGVIKDPAQATAWLQKAANQGDVLSQIDLARRYHSGAGGERDDKTALAWFYVAMRNSASNLLLLHHTDIQQVAREMLELENELGPDKTREARRISNELPSS